MPPLTGKPVLSINAHDLVHPFVPALAIGHANEQIIFDEFRYHGIPIVRTEGKNDFYGYLPDSRSIEVKLDLRSQTTQFAAIEEPTMRKDADILIQTLCYAVVLDREKRELLTGTAR